MDIPLTRVLIVCLMLGHVSGGRSALEDTNVLLFRSAYNLISKTVLNLEKEAYMRTPELIKNKGYPVEIHTVTTEDGYVLELHRIPEGRHGNDKASAKRLPVVVINDILTSSAVWVMSATNESLGFILSDAGFDVWLCNTRGNTYSRHHETLKPEDTKFWKFTIDEIVRHDVPAILDYVTTKTERKNVYTMGPGYGGGALLMTLGTKPQYNENVKLHVGLTAIGMLDSTVKTLADFGAWNLEFLIDYLIDHSTGEVMANREWLQFILRAWAKGSPRSAIKFLLSAFTKFDGHTINESRFSTYISHLPAGTSIYFIKQLAKFIQTGEFRAFDWGKEENIRRWGSEIPPLYKFNNVTSPALMVWTPNDIIKTRVDVENLAKQLQRAETYGVPDHRWNHLDYIWGMNCKEAVYDYVIDYVRKFESNNP